MIPYNYRSYYPARTQLHNIGWAKIPPPKETVHAPTEQHQQRQIQVNSTIDADIVLRRVIEDRAAIIALKSRSATNEAELTKAKSRRRHITKILDRQDQDIANLTTKAKRELAEYNEKSKQYIHSFVLAFDNGDMDKLPRHPFVPPLEELEQAINRRKATLIEKVQADDRVKKLEFISSQERITMKVWKKNEEAFLRAIEISKQQFSNSCETWLNRVNKILAVMPHYSHGIGGMEKKYATEAKQAQVQSPQMTLTYPSPKKCDPLAQYRSVFGQDLAMPSMEMSSCDKEFVTPERSMKRPIEIGVEASPKRHVKVFGNFRPMCSEFPGDADNDRRSGLVQEESTENKRLKTGSPPLVSPVVDSHSEDCDTLHVQDGADPQIKENSGNQHLNDEMSIARVLTSLQGNKFAVPYI